jgi:hypothetical protein
MITVKWLATGQAQLTYEFDDRLGVNKTEGRINRVARFATEHGYGLRVNGVVVPYLSLTRIQRLQVFADYLEHVANGIARAEIAERRNAITAVDIDNDNESG